MTTSTIARGMLLSLAHHLRPAVAADLSDDGVLVVSNGVRRVEITVVTKPLDPGRRTPPTVEYSNVHTGEVYGSIAHVEEVATKVLAELGASTGR